MNFDQLSSDYYDFAAEFSPEDQATLSKIRHYLETELAPKVNDLWATETFPTEAVKPLAELGILGQGFKESTHFHESFLLRGWTAFELARVDASLATFVGVQSELAGGSIAHCGSEEQRQQWLPGIADGSIIAACGITEPNSGSDTARGMETTATRKGDRWILEGKKRWIGNGTWADVCVIWARDTADQQVKGFIVPTETQGFSAEKIVNKQSLRIVQNANITLDNVDLPNSALLEHGNSFADLARVLRYTRMLNGWFAIGAQAGAYELALAYAKSRKQFGKPIGGYQMIQDLLVKSLGNLTASLSMMVQLAKLHDRGKNIDEPAALAKAYTSSRARETVSWCRELFGGNGIDLDYSITRFFNDVEAIHTYEGTREINTLIVGRDITGLSAFV